VLVPEKGNHHIGEHHTHKKQNGEIDDDGDFKISKKHTPHNDRI